MAVTEQQKTGIARRFAREVYVEPDQIKNCDVNALRAAAGNVYDWIENNQTILNNIFPATFKTNATAEQKSKMFKIAMETFIETL